MISTQSTQSAQPAAHVLITGAAGQIGYTLAFRIANGDLLRDRKVILHLFDLPSMMSKLNGIVMELQDCAFPLLEGIIASAEYETGFKDVDYGFLVASAPLKAGQVRADLLKSNAKIFKEQGEALSKYSKKTVKVLIVGNPVNTNCLVCMSHAKNLTAENFACLCRLDQNRSESELARRLKIPVNKVHRCIVWGNHAESQVPDMFQATYETKEGEEKKITESFSFDFLTNDFVKQISQRAWEVRNARGTTSVASAANASMDHMRDWIFGTKEGEYSSMGISVPDNEPYGIKKGIIYSFPCTVDAKGKVYVVENLELNEWTKKKLQESEKDLINEKKTAFDTLKVRNESDSDSDLDSDLEARVEVKV